MSFFIAAIFTSLLNGRNHKILVGLSLHASATLSVLTCMCASTDVLAYYAGSVTSLLTLDLRTKPGLGRSGKATNNTQSIGFTLTHLEQLGASTVLTRYNKMLHDQGLEGIIYGTYVDPHIDRQIAYENPLTGAETLLH